ncbi:MAG: arginine--tRNA ligase [Pseudomonadota bacterium]|nr:arginine--tRNA ligase [Pseudomonadota bacterium]
MRSQIDNLLKEAVANFAAERGFTDAYDLDPQLERVRDPKHGDFTSNIALRLSKDLGEPPREIATTLLAFIPESTLVANAQIAGPGFINLTLTTEAYQRELTKILETGSMYGCSNIGKGQRILLEYVSANPTGPLHVGHGRHAAYGASLANLLRATGHNVHEEYYVNDAGRQMDILTVSVWLRYLQLLGLDLGFPANAYQGDYVKEIAHEVQTTLGEKFVITDHIDLSKLLHADPADSEKLLDLLIAKAKEMLGQEKFSALLKEALNSVLTDIKDDLAKFGVHPQRWYSEHSLTEGGAIDRALDLLEEQKMLDVRDGATWFKATEYGDEKDRVVIRENGAKTYFASDIAYHFEKRERGFDILLDVLGADHHGYVARVRAGLEAMSESGDSLEVRLVQFVTLYRGREKVQMSTRSGEYVTLRQLRTEVGNDAARFFYVSRSNDQHLDFDLELAKARSNDNPVYYVQYAHARVASLLRKMKEEGFRIEHSDMLELACLTEEAEHTLLVSLSRYPEVLQLAAVNRAPQHLLQYLRGLSANFHSYYNAHRVLVEDAKLRNARITLVLGTRQVLHNGLTLLGVTAPDNM